MRRIVIGTVIVLSVTGLALILPKLWGLVLPQAQAVSLVHIWGGLFFLVIFPLYAWDHVGANRRWLRRAVPLTFSGAVQIGSGTLLILSGVVLLVYGSQAWAWARTLHHLLTYLLAASLLLHYLSPKR
jgi:hypothetical protein